MGWSAHFDVQEGLAYCVGRDITESKRANELIKHNEKRFRALLQNSTDGLSLITADGIPIEISETGKKIVGSPENNFQGMLRPDLIHPDDLETVTGQFTAVLNAPSSVQSMEFRVRLPDNTYRWIGAKFQNLLDEPAVRAMVMNFSDITERKNHISAIEDQNAKLREIAWTQSHIVRAPLSRIIGLTNIMKQYPEENNGELLNALSTAAEELDDVIRKIVKKTELAGI
jgi:PAS domain S-box-containing protein